MSPAESMNQSTFSTGRVARCVAWVGFVAVLVGPTAYGGTVTGNCHIEKILGRTDSYLELNEWNIYAVSPNVNGRAFRVGTLPYPAGHYEFSLPAGTYSMYLDQPLFWGRPKVVWGLEVPGSGTVTRNVELPMDYSCAFGSNSSGWGGNPWTIGANVWYQTFVATGTSVTGVNCKLAGTVPDDMLVAIHRDNGGAITTWPQVGGTRRVYDVNQDADSWIRYRSGDIPTTPGQRYALKLTGSNGSTFAIYRRMEDGSGYTSGQAYDSAGQPQNFDLYANIFSDNDGTLVSYCTMLWDDGYLAGWAGTWTQEVKAMGNGLAGATLYFAEDDTWNKQMTFQVRSGSPTGPVISPVKTAQSASQTGTTGHVAISYNPGEVTLTPGQVYYIEISHPVGFNPHAMNRPDDVYPHGIAYKSHSIACPNVDLHMQVVEYANVAPPTLECLPPSLSRTGIHKRPISDDMFTVRNAGGSVLTYQISKDVPWITVSPTEGSSLGEADPITVHYDLSTLGLGSYTGHITVSAPDATNPQVTIPVNLEVVAPAFASADFDHDGDVDMDDFGHLQECFSGGGIEQTDSDCQNARLDDDLDVDSADLAKMRQCPMKAGLQVVTICSD